MFFLVFMLKLLLRLLVTQKACLVEQLEVIQLVVLPDVSKVE